ncbi:MAG: hypothetical protein JF631_10135 [Mycobacterium sp.]|nr:hypothetical protein [Mycobacterium sp.]
MQWFTVAWWRWRLAQARGRSPLVRTSDRIEVAVMALAVAVLLAAMPVAGAIGTSVHDGHARAYAAEQQDRHRVAATATKDSTASPRGAVSVVAARWQVGDVENAGSFTWNSPVENGSSVDIWVDRQGRHVGPPTPSWHAGVDAIVAAVGFLLSVTAVAALLVASARRLLRRTRYAGWNRDIASLVHDDGGRTNRRP